MPEALLITLIATILGLLTTWGIFFFRGIRNKRKDLRDLKRNSKEELISIYSRFLSLRYMNNILYLRGKNNKLKPINNYLEKDKLIIKNYEEACLLQAKYESLMPSFISLFPATKGDMSFLHSKFQNWRRSIREDKPILQNLEGKTSQELKDLKIRYKKILNEIVS